MKRERIGKRQYRKPHANEGQNGSRKSKKLQHKKLIGGINKRMQRKKAVGNRLSGESRTARAQGDKKLLKREQRLTGISLARQHAGTFMAIDYPSAFRSDSTLEHLQYVSNYNHRKPFFHSLFRNRKLTTGSSDLG